MSIKDLFNQKTVSFKSAESASVDAESIDYMVNKTKEAETFIPIIDFASASNFVKFGSAKEYYISSIERVYKNYPYDGSQSEKLEFTISSSYLDRWMIDNKYPKYAGYGTLTPGAYGAASKTGGYGLNTSTGSYEYIFVGGGVRTRDAKQEDPTQSNGGTPLYKRFDKGPVFDSDNKRDTVFGFSATSCSTFEFWMKKNAFNAVNTQKEVLIDIWNGQASSSANYGRITLEMSASTNGLDTFSRPTMCLKE